MMFVPYVCCGDPNIEFTEKLVVALDKYADIVELGIPFSDPIADGKTIQNAATRALKNGITVGKIFAMAEKLRKEGVETPFVFMTYYNIVYNYGKEKFLQKMKNSGVQGLIVPDLPFGEDSEFEQLADRHGIAIINLIAMNTPEERAMEILENEKMFTYLVAVNGVTGTRETIEKESMEFVKRIRKIAGPDKKLCVGFGISNADQAKKMVAAGADGVIVGSRIIDAYTGGNLEKACEFAKTITQ